VDITTRGCLEHMQQRNKLKGIAMQKIILETIENKKEDISIKKILGIVKGEAKNYFYVATPFKTDYKDFMKYEYVQLNEFKSNLKIFVYKVDKTVSKKWKECSNCGQYILAESQVTKKCHKCNKGFFRYRKGQTKRWVKLIEGSRDKVIDKLKSLKILKQLTFLNKRVDFFAFKNRNFYIFESKNKELSGVNFRDIRSALFYPIIISKCGYRVNKVKIIFNGSFQGELANILSKGITKKYYFKVDFQRVCDYLKEKGINIKGIDIEYKDGKYIYNVVKGDAETLEIRIKSYKEIQEENK